MKLDLRLTQDPVQAHPFNAQLIAEHQPLANERLHEAVETSVCLEERPVEPADLVVLAVDVVVPRWVRRTSSPISNIGVPSDSSVMARKFFTWRSRSRSIPDRPSALGPAVPTEVGVGPVAAALPVGLVVLVVVADQVVQREPVVGGDEVDALFRSAFLWA